jgi:hypothetical protein
MALESASGFLVNTFCYAVTVTVICPTNLQKEVFCLSNTFSIKNANRKICINEGRTVLPTYLLQDREQRLVE